MVVKNEGKVTKSFQRNNKLLLINKNYMKRKKIIGKSGKVYWAIVNDPDLKNPGVEIGPSLSDKYLKSIGMSPDLKTKSFSELSEEDKKLYTELWKDDNIETEGI